MSEATPNAEPGAEPGIEADDTDAASIVVIGIVSTVLVLACVLGVTALFDHWSSQLTAERVVGAQYNELESAVEEQRTRLNSSPSRDNATGAYTIPIDDAMALVVKEMSAAQK